MKKLFAIMLFLVLALTLCACGGPSDEEIKAVRNVSFAGTELTVTLGANQSTGYEWDYEIFGECIEPAIGRTFKITGSKGDATGEEITDFTGMSAGTAVIVFTTPNGWDGTGEGDGYTVNVVVGADGTIEKANGMDGAFPVETAPAPTPEPTPVPTPEPTPEPTPKTSVVIAELADGTYTGTLSGSEFVNNEGTIFTTIMPADVTVTIENGQITLYSDSTTTAFGVLNGVKTPQAPDANMILSGSLPLQQSGDAVIAEGELTSLGKSLRLHFTNGKYKSWELVERSGDGKYACTVYIAMTNGVPAAAIVVNVKGQLNRTATVPLALASGAEAAVSEGPLSAPYAEMLKSGDYQYTYSLEYEGKPYTATIATYNGMICRKVVSDDGTFSQRVITINGNAWKADDLTGAVVDGGAENAETQPDYSTLTFVGSKTLETGAIADAYDFEYAGIKCNLVFLFAPEGKLVALILTAGDETSQMDILNFSRAGNDRTLFDVPQ